MRSRYNIALIPQAECDHIISLAQTLAQTLVAMADCYVLGDKSLPHVTLCQFMADESDLATLWRSVGELRKQQSLSLTFKQFSCISAGDLCWVSLLPDQRDVLNAMYHAVVRCVKNPIKQLSGCYDPHMTLFNAKAEKYEIITKTLSGTTIFIEDRFILSLGKSDDLGQLTEVIL